MKNLPAGSEIFLITLEQKKDKIPPNELERIFFNLKKNNIHLIPLVYFSFGIKSIVAWSFYFIRLLLLCFIKNVRYIHCWCTPAGSIGYLLSAITKKTLILDSFEPHAEPMVESGTWQKNSIAFKLLFNLERLQAQKAKIVIACVKEMYEYSKIKYGITLRNFYNKPACVDFNSFSPGKTKNPALLIDLKLKDKIVCVYAGKFGGSYLTNEIFEFIKVCQDYWGSDNFRFLLLSNHNASEIKMWCQKNELSPDVVVFLFVSFESVPDYIGLGDFGIVPFKPVPSKRYGSPIKTGEYLAMGLPIVITQNISDDSEIIDQNNVGYVLKELSTAEYIIAVQKIDQLLKNSHTFNLKEKIIRIAEKYRSFKIAEEIYRNIYG